MTDENDQLTSEQIAAITAFVDTAVPPPEELPTAHLIFGTNQIRPIEIVAERYHDGLAPLIIATGGVNRHNGIIEGREFQRWLVERGVPTAVIRVEDTSANTEQNVQFALPFLHEALDAGLTVTAITKWYHRRAVHALKTHAPEIAPFHTITWDPIYGGEHISRRNWWQHPGGRPRVLREHEEVSRRVRDGSFADTELKGGSWH